MSLFSDTISKIQNPFSTAVSKGGARPADFTSFSITEYVNNAAQLSTKISLRGNQLPMQPFQWTGEQRLAHDYYPGNPEAVVQVLGAKEGELTIRGRLKDRQYDDDLYGASYQFVRAIDAMRKRGNLVKFGLEGVTSWFRYGFIEKVDFKLNKLSYIDYEISFLVVSENQPRNDFFAAPDKTAPSSINANLIAAADEFNSTYSIMPDSMPRSIGDELNSLIGGVASVVAVVTTFADTILSTGNELAASANRALGLIKYARAQLSSYRRQVDTLSHSFSNLSLSNTPAAKTSDTYRNLSHIQASSRASISISQYLARMQAQFERLAKTVPIARYKVIQGDSLQKIAIKFYGASDNWKAIYDHNLLTSTALVPGRVLEIPKV